MKLTPACSDQFIVSASMRLRDFWFWRWWISIKLIQKIFWINRSIFSLIPNAMKDGLIVIGKPLSLKDFVVQVLGTDTKNN